MKSYLKINQRAYDRLAEEYRQQRQEFVAINKHIASPFVRLLKKGFKVVNVLELGPGAGTELAFFNSNKFKTTAIDISEKMIAVAREMAPHC